MGVCSSACWRPLRAALFASFQLAALAGVAVAEPLSDGVNAYGRKDYATARRALRPLAERGSAIAQFYLGLSYERGKRVSESEAEAVNWFRKAAEQGLAASQAALGTRYFIGWGVPQSYAEAMNWSLKAAKQGNPSAQAILGMIYESGYGVPKNFVLAYMWFTISAHDPDFEPGTRRNLDEIARHLAPSQITEAKSLAQQCLQTGYVDCTQASQVARQDAAAPVSTTSDTILSSRTRVPLRTDRGISFVSAEINGTLKLDFAIDSGASDVSVPADVFSTLKRTSTLKESDLIGQQSYVLADGSTTQSSIFKIRSLKIGELVVEDVKASVTPSHATLLLGQSFLNASNRGLSTIRRTSSCSSVAKTVEEVCLDPDSGASVSRWSSKTNKASPCATVSAQANMSPLGPIEETGRWSSCHFPREKFRGNLGWKLGIGYNVREDSGCGRSFSYGGLCYRRRVLRS